MANIPRPHIPLPTTPGLGTTVTIPKPPAPPPVVTPYAPNTTIPDIYTPSSRDMSLEVTDTQEGFIAPICYGRCRFSPKLVHFDIVSTYIEMIALVGEGELDAFEAVYIDDTEVYAATKAWATVQVRPGSLTQTAVTCIGNATIATKTHPGQAYVAMRVDLETAPLNGGIPNISVVVRGRKVYNLLAAAVWWNENPVDAVLDAMRASDYGAGIPDASIDLAGSGSLYTAEQACDTTVGGEKQFRVSIVVAQRQPIESVAKSILQVCNGRTGRWDGKHRITLDGSAAGSLVVSDLQSPVPDIPILQDTLSCGRNDSEVPNTTQGQYLDTTTWTQLPVKVETLAVQQGLEQPRILDVGFVAVPSGGQLYRLLATWLARAGRTWRASCSVPQHGMRLTPGSTVAVTSRLFTGKKTVLVDDLSDAPGGTFSLALVEYDVADFSTASYTPQANVPTTTVSTAAVVNATGTAVNVTGIVNLANGGTGVNLIGGGPGFLKQASVGANVTVAALSASDISSGQLGVANGGTGLATLAAGYVPVGNGTSAFSAVQATDANTASTIVQRDASGNFSAGTISAALTGTASLATALAGGTAGYIPFQTAAGATAFDAGLTWDNTNKVAAASNLNLSWQLQAGSIRINTRSGGDYGIQFMRHGSTSVGAFAIMANTDDDMHVTTNNAAIHLGSPERNTGSSPPAVRGGHCADGAAINRASISRM